MKYIKSVIPIVTLIVGIFIGSKVAHQDKPIVEVVEKRYDDLTSWQMLELAIMKTESGFNTMAIGKHQDCGVLQITPVYVEEVNRLLDTAYYFHTDAFDITKSLEMFNLYQDAKNPNHDIERAIRLHNPGGDAIGYSKNVMSNYKFILALEEARKSIIEGGL